MQICRNINTWKCNCWAISLDKQGQCCDKVHLTLYTVLSTATLSKAMGLTRCARVCLCFCVCVFDRTTQVFSPRPPRYHQSLSSSFIKHRRCTWACVLHQYPPPTCLPTFFCCTFTLPHFSLWAFPNAAPRRPRGMQICTLWRSELM